MRAVKYEPFRELRTMQHRMNNWLHSFSSLANFGDGKNVMPACDVEETDSEIIVRIDVPDLDENEISVRLLGDNLVVKGERKSGKDEEKKQYHYLERYQGLFERVIPLPSSVDKDKISAEYQKGILEVKLPKMLAVKVKEIKIHVI